MSAATGTANKWVKLHYQLNEKGESCQCGHFIKNVFILTDDQGHSIRVGSECVKSLTALTPEMNMAEKRAKRAAAQWRKLAPPAKPGETREQYINRRVVEMGNAAAAYRAWVMKWRKNNMFWATRQIVDRQLPSLPYGTTHFKENGIFRDYNVNAPHEGLSMHECWLCQQKKALVKAYDELRAELTAATNEVFYAEHEAEYAANRYDFTRNSWDIAKI